MHYTIISVFPVFGLNTERSVSLYIQFKCGHFLCSAKVRYSEAASACNFFQKRLWHCFFPVNFAKFLRKLFLLNTFEHLPPNIYHCVKSGPHFPAFGLNTERYSVSLRIQSECWKIRTRKNSVFGHFSCSVPVWNL